VSTRLTIEEIADLAAVSRSTVSRVLNNHPSVRPTVRARVQQVIQEHRYTPRAAARSLASRRTNVVGLLIPRSAATIFADPFFPHVIQGITETCSNHGYFLLLSMVTAEREQDFYERVLRGRHVDGLIMLSSDIDDPILPLLIRDESALVLVGRHPYLTDVNSADVDNRDGAVQGVRHLVQLGHRRIATITGPLYMAGAMDRRDGYKQALAEAAISIRPELIVEGDYTQAGGYACMRQLLDLAERPGAVFVASDVMAAGALRAIHEAGLRVPDDIALVSFDDLPLATILTPPLTTVHQPLYELGAAAAELLLRRLDQPDDHRPTHVVLPTHLVVRQSSGAPARRPLSGA
jgi:LacI family transcriptional regulator, galactose operon repressor